MKKFLRLYTRMTNCCFLFSLQAGAVIIAVLGIAWTSTSLLINLFLPHETAITGMTVLQYSIAYAVLILICVGHVCILGAASTANPNLMLLGFLFNTVTMMVWLLLSAMSYYNSTDIRTFICIEGRCPDVLWLFDAYWRDTGVNCTAGTDPSPMLATRELFTIAPLHGYFDHWPDYIQQPGLGAPCYNNIPDTADYVSYDKGGGDCPKADWLSWDMNVTEIRKQIIDGEKSRQNAISQRASNYHGKIHKRLVDINCWNGDFNCTIVYDNFNSTNLNGTAEFTEFLHQGCYINQPDLIVASLSIALFFACFFLFGRAIEFNYYHELIMPFTLEGARFRPPPGVTVTG